MTASPSAEPTGPPPPAHPHAVFRAQQGKVIGGVAAGLGRRLGIDPVLLRIAFVVFSVAGGWGAILYLGLWIALPAEGSGESIAQSAARNRQDLSQVVAVGCLTLGGLLLIRQIGPWFDDRLVWPVVLSSVGLAVIWRQAGEEDRAALVRVAGQVGPGDVGARRMALARAIVGVVLVMTGVGTFLAANNTFDATRDALLGTAVIGAGLAVVFGPWWWRLGKDLARERGDRIRADERAEVAAHLHDSVLQTLALIQRSADDPRSVTALARQQERELRSWLYKPSSSSTAVGSRFAAAVEAVGDEVERLHGVPVEVVTVGDLDVDDRVGAVVAATREAVINAAKWSGASEVAVFAEVEPRCVSVFVRDRGAGFDPAQVASDRHGIRESIVGRMQRHGGAAAIRSEPGEGTEVELTLPLEDR